MSEIGKDITGIFMAIVGVGLLFVIVSPNNKTTQVIQAATGGFSQALSTAMGGGYTPTMGG